MTSEIAREVAHHIHRKRQEMVDFLAQLVEAESPSLVPESQDAVFNLCSDLLESIGYQVTQIPGKATGGQLFARPAHRVRGQPCQLLLGHSDTVWPLGTLNDMPVVVENGIIKGPGVYDMKAGIVQSLFALRTLQELRIDICVTPCLFVNSDEEIGSRESSRMIRHLARRMSRVFVLEPGTGRLGHLKTARKGTGQFHIRVVGKAAHAGVEPEMGASAIVELSYVIQKLNALNDQKRGITVNVGMIDGGMRPNVVAPESEAIVDVRVPTSQEAVEIETAIHALQPETKGVQLQIRGGIGRQPMERTPRNRLLWNLARDMAVHLELEIEESVSGGGSDGNITSLYTATLDGLGAVGGGAHAPHEFVLIDKMVERSALLALLMSAPAADPTDTECRQ